MLIPLLSAPRLLCIHGGGNAPEWSLHRPLTCHCATSSLDQEGRGGAHLLDLNTPFAGFQSIPSIQLQASPLPAFWSTNASNVPFLLRTLQAHTSARLVSPSEEVRLQLAFDCLPFSKMCSPFLSSYPFAFMNFHLGKNIFIIISVPLWEQMEIKKRSSMFNHLSSESISPVLETRQLRHRQIK